MASEVEDEFEGVVELTDETMDQAVKDYDYLFCVFFGPQYGCSRQAGNSYRFARELTEKRPGVKVAIISCFTDKKACAKYGISDNSYGENMFFIKGEKVDISESLYSYNETYEWIRRQIAPTSEHIISTEQAEQALDQNKIVTLFFGTTDSKGYAAYLEASKSISFMKYCHTDEQSLREKYNVQGEAILLQRSQDNETIVYTGDYSKDSIKDFIALNLDPSVPPFRYRFFWNKFSLKRRDSVYLILNSTQDNTNVMSACKAIADEFKRDLEFQFVDIAQPDELRWVESLEFAVDKIPAVLIKDYSDRRNGVIRLYNKIHYLYQEEEVTEEKLRKFAQDCLDGLLQRVLNTRSRYTN